MEPTDQAVLLVERGPGDAETVTLSAGTITLGRQSINDVVVSAAGVSRQHAQILESGGGYYLRDLHSTNGTYVNSQRITEDYLLNDGDKICLGASKIILVFRSPTANTLQVTLADESEPVREGSDTWLGQVVSPTEDAENAALPDKQPVADTASKEARDTELYEGTVRLDIRAEGSMGMVVNFAQRLRDMPEFRVVRLENNSTGGVDIWLALRQPIHLRCILATMEGVAQVSPTRERDLSPGSGDTPLTVLLKVTGPMSR